MNEKTDQAEKAAEASERMIGSQEDTSELVSYGRASQRTRGAGWGTSFDWNGFPFPA